MAIGVIIGPVADPWYVTKEVIDIPLGILALVLETAIELKYVQLAENYRDLYSRGWDYYNTNFQIAGEAPFADQVFNHPLVGNGQANALFYTPQYAAQWNVPNIFRAQGAFSRFWWQNHANMYADAPLNYGCDPRGNPITVGEPEQLDIYATVDDADSYLYRYEEHLKDVYDERSWEWQNQSLNFGVKQASIVESGLATSFRYMDDASSNVADWFATQSDGLFKYASYRHSEAASGAALRQASLTGTRLARGNVFKDIPTDIIDNGRSVEGNV